MTTIGKTKHTSNFVFKKNYLLLLLNVLYCDIFLKVKHN